MFYRYIPLHEIDDTHILCIIAMIDTSLTITVVHT